jgi:hypothetical protein
MRSNTKLTGNLFAMRDDRTVIATAGELRRQFEIEFGKRSDELFDRCKRDAIAQFMAVALTELAQEYGFGRERLHRFKRGMEGLFVAMAADGIMGRKFDTTACIELMREKYGIDVDEKEI